MKRRLFLIAILSCLPFLIWGQEFKITWKRVAMDSTYRSERIFPIDKIIADHQEAMGSMMEILIYSSEEISKGQPEGALSNLAADVLLDGAIPYIDNDYPTLSLTNFGGIRSAFPKGAVRLYDVYSVFPFENCLVVAQIKGKSIRKILNRFASYEKFEALGGVQITVKEKELKSCLIGGKPLDDDAVYNLATIDFLLDGGDRFNIADDAISITRTGIVIRDLIADYLKKLSARGVVLDNSGDSRIVLEKEKKNNGKKKKK